MSKFLDLLNDDCHLHIMKFLGTTDLMNLKKASPRLTDNVLSIWRRQKKVYVGGSMEMYTDSAERIQFWSLIAPVVEDVTLDCLESHHLRELQKFTYPKAKTLLYSSLENMMFNDGQFKRLPQHFPELRILKLNCLTSAKNIWRFAKLDELYCGMYMTPTENVFKKLFFILSLRKFELVYNTYNLQMMHPMIKSIWYCHNMETICVDDWQLCCCSLPRILIMPRLSKIQIYGGEYDAVIMNHLVEERAHDVHTLLYHTLFRCQQFHHDAWLKMPNLKKLIFVKDRMPTSTIRQLKKQLKLKEFHMEKCSRPAGAALIQLLDWEGLELINLTNTEVSYDYVIKFKEKIKTSLSKRTTPVTIYIYKTTLTEDQLKEIVDSHPMVKISTKPLNTCVSIFKNFFHVELITRESRNSL